MSSDAHEKASFLRTNKVEIFTACIIGLLGVGLGMALPEDQSMPHKFNRVIAVRTCCHASSVPGTYSNSAARSREKVMTKVS